MRVGLVRNVALGMVALVGLGLAGCDDNPTDFEADETVRIFANPTVMTVPAGETTLLLSRTENQGNEPTWEEISATVDATCGSGTVTVAPAEVANPELDPPGRFDVTGGTTWGETCIELSGGGANATVEVMVVGDSLGLTGAPEDGQLVVFQTVQLSAGLFGADGSAVGPFDPTTDLVWSSDDEDVLTVDGTGLVTAEGAGTATITATWTEFGVELSAFTVITVVVPAPTLTSTDVAVAQALDLVTITGTGFIPGAHDVLIDGFEVPAFYEATIVDETTATVLMPGGPAADVTITVGVTGEVSNGLDVARICGTFTDCPTEPANDAPNTAPMVVLPFSADGVTDPNDINDFYAFTLAAETTFEINLDWVGGSVDMDLGVTDPGFTVVVCGNVARTSGDKKPENGQCTLPAGEYRLWVNDFDGLGSAYDLDITIVP